MKKKPWIVICAVALLLAMAVNLSGCAARVQAADLMEGISGNRVKGKEMDLIFASSQMELAVKLLQGAVDHSEKENLMISPLSVQLALAMTANGAAGQTRQEMEQLLGGNIPLERLNEYLYSYVDSLTNQKRAKLGIANSIWFRDDEGRLQVEQEFLQRNADYYKAQAYKSAFDEQTIKDMNTWVSLKTDGMIDSIVEEIPEETVMYLINALVFDAKWQVPYKASDVFDGQFTTLDGEKQTVDMMHSEEDLYLEDDKITGFLKEYEGAGYSFAALLPKEGVELYDYISTLTAESLTELLSDPKTGAVRATMPKFSFDYELTMNETLKALGMPTAFCGDQADFSAMAHSNRGNIFIGDVLHKTYLSVDELGTKAGAVTKVEMMEECGIFTQWQISLDRPFVFLILDRTNNLPLFMGIVTEV